MTGECLGGDWKSGASPRGALGGHVQGRSQPKTNGGARALGGEAQG